MSISQSRFFHISTNGKLSLIPVLSDALESIKDGGYLWLDYCQPTKEDLFKLVEPFGLHPLSIEDSTDNEQLPKVENFSTYTFLIFNAFEIVSDELLVRELDVFIGSNFLITVSSQILNGDHLLKGMERVLPQENSKIAQGPSFLLHLILDQVVDQKFLTLETLEENLDRYEENILTDLSGFNPSSLMNARRNMLAIRKSLFHEREIIGKIVRLDSPYFSEKSVIYFRDIYDHLSKYYEMSESARDLVTSLMEMYLSMLNNKMTKAANQTNVIVRRLTLITTIFMPLTLISGIGGMSEFTMMTGGEAHWHIAYFVLLIVMFVIALINYRFLKRLEKQTSDLDF
jgi:magnesium transporter